MESSPCLLGAVAPGARGVNSCVCVHHCCRGAQALLGPGWEAGEGISAEHGVTQVQGGGAAEPGTKRWPWRGLHSSAEQEGGHCAVAS